MDSKVIEALKVIKEHAVTICDCNCETCEIDNFCGRFMTNWDLSDLEECEE